LFVRATHRG